MPAQGAFCDRRPGNRAMNDFSLIETLRFEPETGFMRLRLHLARLTRSARRIGFAEPRHALDELNASVQGATGALRIRLTFDAQGGIEVTTAPFTPLASGTVWNIRIAST